MDFSLGTDDLTMVWSSALGNGALTFPKDQINRGPGSGHDPTAQPKGCGSEALLLELNALLLYLTTEEELVSKTWQ
jgi:hypothetical protein